MLASTKTFHIEGVTARPVTIEADVRDGIPSLTFVGMPDMVARERRERLQAAFANSGLRFPTRRVTVNVAPASVRSSSPAWDLAAAAAILAADGQVPLETLGDWSFWGEVCLDGSLRPTSGAVAAAQRAVADGDGGLVLPTDSAARAVLAGGAMTYDGAGTLNDVVALLRGERRPAPPPAPDPAERDSADLADVRCDVRAVRALMIAAAGGHSLLLSGPAGAGTTMLARRLTGLLPPLTGSAALEVARIQDIAGTPGALLAVPYRAPHASVSTVGLIGGGRHGHLGELTLGHRGVVVLADVDTIAPDAVLEAQRAAATGEVTVTRGTRTLRLPARPILVATTTRDASVVHPGLSTGPDGLALYDVVVTLSLAPSENDASTVTSTAAAALVRGARDRQIARRGGGTLNGWVSGTAARMLVTDSAAQGALTSAVRAGAIHRLDEERVLRVARTIADLDNSPEVTQEHVLEALTFAMPCIAEAGQV